MKLKNEALQKLYDKLASDTFAFNVVEQSIIDEIFKQCDEELSDSITFAQIKDLQDRCDIFEKSNGTLLGANLDLATKKSQLEKDLDNAKKNVEYFRHSRDGWKSRAKYAEEAVDNMRTELEAKVKRMDEITKERDSYRDHYTEIREAFDKLSGENKKLKARADCLHEEVLWYRKHYKEQSDKIQELKSRLNSVYGVCGAGYEQGQTDLWVKLQMVKDMKLDGFDPECETLGDIIDMDLEDFLDAYKIWQETKEHERIIKDACDAFYYGFKAGLASEVPVDRN